MISCSPYTRFVRVDPGLQRIRENMDSIAVFVDALAAIDKKNDFYSANASYNLDSLILFGTTTSLLSKGYGVKIIEPCLMGSFMDTMLAVPFKPLNSHSVERDALPCVFPCDLTETQLAALSRVCRKLYLTMTHADEDRRNTLLPAVQTRNDLDTIAALIDGNYVLFVFHQALLVDPSLTAGLAFGAFALTALLTGGAVTGYATKSSVFHTYMVLLELSTGSVAWSNYARHNAAPTTPLIEISEDYEHSIAEYIEPDTLAKRVLYRWHKTNLSPFPARSETDISEGSRKRYPYPAQTFFDNTPFRSVARVLNPKLERKIDSLVTDLSMSKSKVHWNDDDTTQYAPGKGRWAAKFEEELAVLDEYLRYACYSRYRYNPALRGSLKLSFIVTVNGGAKRVKVLESTLEDHVIDYAIPRILKMVKFSTTPAKTGATEITHEFSFGTTGDEVGR